MVVLNKFELKHKMLKTINITNGPAMQGWKGAIDMVSVRRPQPYNTNSQKERQERKKQ